MATKHRGPGRPEWTAPDLTVVEKLASRGLPRALIAHALGISPRTLRRHCMDSRPLDDAIRLGHGRGMAFIANRLFETAKGGDVRAAIYFLKTRPGWRNVVEEPPEPRRPSAQSTDATACLPLFEKINYYTLILGMDDADLHAEDRATKARVFEIVAPYETVLRTDGAFTNARDEYLALHPQESSHGA